MRKERKNESLLWFGKWTSKLGNIVFDYANSVSIVSAFSHTWPHAENRLSAYGLNRSASTPAKNRAVQANAMVPMLPDRR